MLAFLVAGLTVLTACTSGQRNATSGHGAATAGQRASSPASPSLRTSPASPSLPAPAAYWTEFRHLPGVVDVAGPRADGSFVVSAAGRLYLLNGLGALTPFARGAGGYLTGTGESYLTVAGNVALASKHCSFSSDDVFAIEPSGTRPAVIEIGPAERALRFAGLPAGEFLDGIAFDGTGRFGHRLLVTGERNGATTVYGIDCAGTVAAIARGGPPVEGGIAVAPPAFGSFGGDLIAPNETSGRVYAFAPSGSAVRLASSGLPSGGDIGVESAGFVPLGFAAGWSAYLADRYSGQANKHPGDDSLLRLTGARLLAAGVRPGDLLVAAEGGAATVDIRCAAECAVRYIAEGPAIAHGEGHVAFIP